MSLLRLLKRGWNEVPEMVIMGTITLALLPPAFYCAYDVHNRPFHYRSEYTVVRDDDPYAAQLREAYKNFVPHTVPRK